MILRPEPRSGATPQGRVFGDDRGTATPRTLIVVSTDRRRGAEVFTERLRDGLCAREWVVEAVSVSSSGLKPRADVDVLVDRDPTRMGRFDWVVVRALRAKIKTFKPDLLIANGGSTLRYGVVAKIGLECSLVYVGIGEPEYWIRSRLSRWTNRAMLRQADQILAVSDKTRLQLLELEPKLEGRIHVAYTGIPETLLRLEVNEPVGPLRVLMMGSLSAEKDPMRALRSVASVDGALLRFVGDGPLSDDLKLESRRLGVSDRVEFLGSVSDVVPHLVWAHLLILTSRTEGLPGAILEAGAAGIPTLTVDVGGVREAVVGGMSGVVVDHDDERLVEALRVLEADREGLAQMGKAARKHIASHFLLDDVIEGWARLLLDAWR